MKNRKWIAGGAVALLVGLTALWLWLQDDTREAFSSITGRFTGLLQRPTVDPNLVESAGRLEAQEFDLAVKNGGRVIAIDLEEGDTVEKGETVARLEKSELEAMLRSAEAELQRAQEGLIQANAVVVQRESDVTLADAELRRAVMLHGRDYLSGASYDQRKAAHDNAEAALLLAAAQQRAAAAGVTIAQAEMARMRVNLADMDVVSPISGRVLYKLVEPGAVVSSGQRLATLLDMSDVFITIFLPMEQAGRLVIGQDATVALDALPTQSMTARVVFISPRAQFTPKTVETKDERSKFMFRVKVRITSPNGVPLNPGLPAVARIQLPVPPMSML